VQTDLREVFCYNRRMAKYFTPDEANHALPRVRALVQQIMHARQNIIDARPELWPVLEKGLGNGGSKKAGEMIQECRRVEDGFRDLKDLGVVVKDISIGLVDFPALRAGREILLCWQYDEPEVAYWHELQGGYAGRQKIQ
jgi:hypothetical protein